ncbi:MAG TPA: hypothetical protein VGD65_04005 [Chryseosolibacter sp.]
MRFLKLRQAIAGFLKTVFANRRGRMILSLVALSLLSVYLVFWVLSPSSGSIQAPVFVAHSECDSLPSLTITILEKQKLRIEASFEKCTFAEWNTIQLQAPEDSHDITLVINGEHHTLSETLIRQIKVDSYLKVSKQFLKENFPDSSYASMGISLTTAEGLYKKSFNRFFLSILFIPVNKKNDAYPVPVNIIAPQSFLMTSSIPEAYRIFLLKDGISYTVPIIPERTGMLVNFDDLEAEASREIIIFFATSVLGFIIGIILEKTFSLQKH